MISFLGFRHPSLFLLPSPSSCHPPHDMPAIWERRCWGKEGDFIWKASRLRRWQTHVLKPRLHLGLISSFVYIEEVRVGGTGAQEVTMDLRHLDVSKDLRRVSWVSWLESFHRPGSDHDVPVRPWQPIIIFVHASLSSGGGVSLGQEAGSINLMHEQNSFWWK